MKMRWGALKCCGPWPACMGWSFWKAEGEKLPAELWSGKQRETTSGLPSGPLPSPFSQTSQIMKRETFMLLSQLFEVADIVYPPFSHFFFHFKEKKILHSCPLKADSFHPSISASPESPFSSLCDSFFQMKSSRDPHQPFPNLLQQCCWE